MAIQSLSTTALRRELSRRERGAKPLIAKRDKFQRRLDAILSQLAELGIEGGGGSAGGKRRGRKPGPKPGSRRGRKPGRPAAGGGKRRRAKNSMTLPDALSAAIKSGATITPADAAQRVKSRGFKSTSKNFGMMVSNALSKDKRFKRLSRGQYKRVG